MRYVKFMLALFASAAHADGFYVDGGLSVLQNRNLVSSELRYMDAKEGERIPYNYVHFHNYDINHTENPYGSLSFGYDFSFKKFTIDFRAQHMSSIIVSDHGENSVKLSIRWYPFSN